MVRERLEHFVHLHRPQPAGEGHVIGGLQALCAEEQHEMLGQCPANLGETRVIERGEIDAVTSAPSATPQGSTVMCW